MSGSRSIERPLDHINIEGLGQLLSIASYFLHWASNDHPINALSGLSTYLASCWCTMACHSIMFRVLIVSDSLFTRMVWGYIDHVWVKKHRETASSH